MLGVTGIWQRRMDWTVRAALLLRSGCAKSGSFQLLQVSSDLLPAPFRPSGICLRSICFDGGLRTCASSMLAAHRRRMNVEASDRDQSCADYSGSGLGGSEWEELVAIGRRQVLMWIVLVSLSAQMARAEDSSPDIAPLPLEVFSDAKDGFTMLRPAEWNKVDKPGATVYFEDPQSSKNNIGVTVNPVRISSLKAFGTLDDVTEKLIAAERDKPSTKDMQVIRVQERQLLQDTPLYQLEYTLDTSRGSKRVLTAVTVSANKLYILNIIYTDGLNSPAPIIIDTALHEVLNSFDLLA